ncbi:CDP-6-deoxy-delta-3,4-glucoseen reductase [Candidatus Vallotia cooleyia]|uniref:CDP-6-deoxy-delta-3,4-glucoseen reductase n=1 Tax=Candidatus Vallotiella adelgis TaxID=1177211 RepID=UPI001D029088|nr:CDP-6-deoxy-delta-3,4-glucoseen reductase [Candidatus Vallotia cooleyia]UDG82120.1 CDP-6-deoxy-L-threo-D-glycero-4-hexulose-3-dehydrase reductase [Candidatus Vallotia cooleyia]
MAFSVTLRQSGKKFQVEADEPVLIAALRQSIRLPYGCKNGTCGLCKGRLIGGSTKQRAHSLSALSKNEEAQGMALFCCTTAQSDLEIDIHEITGIGDMPVKKLPCRVNALERVTHNVIVLKLQLPANERLQYLAGQYIQFILKNGARRSYSMANAPHHQGPLELHIRHIPGGSFTDHVFNAIQKRDILRFEGPFGMFFLREHSDKPIVLLASGTGFAPIKAIIEHARFTGATRPMTLYWGGNRRSDLYLLNMGEQWEREVPRFKFIPVLSAPNSDDNWCGRIGLVHRAVIEDLPDLSKYQVYACGASAMVEAAQHDFSTYHGLPAQEFYADLFY